MRSRLWRRVSYLIFGGLVVAGLNGCSRSFWRSQADFDALTLLENKQFDPRWDIPRTTLDADPRSRFYDPYDLDCEPLPPDDPAASQYMEWVYGMRGYKSWHKFGESMSVENPQWLENFGLKPDTFHDAFLKTDGLTTVDDVPREHPVGMSPTIENLTLAQAIELASIHSRDYQTQLENLFLSSLQLSLDQFQFNVRYLAFGGRPTGDATFTTTSGGPSSMLFSTQAGVSQILPTGAQWVAGLANNTLWLFSGGTSTTSQSLLSYSLVQPLLQGAGRKVILENLTFTERNVLYNVRLLARYRKLFFADAVVNTGGGSTSSAAAISSSSGSSVQNPTVISTNASVNVAPGTTVGTSSAAGTGAPQGYLGLLFQLQQVLNQRENVALLRGQTERLRELVSQTPFRRLPAGALPNGIVIPPDLMAKVEYSAETRRLRWKGEDIMSVAERDALLALSEDTAYRAAVNGLYDQLRIGVTTVDILTVATNLTRAEIQERALTLGYFDEIDQYKFFLGLPIDMQISIDKSLLKPFELTDPRLIDTELNVIEFVKQTAAVSDEDPPLVELRQLVDDFQQLMARVKESGIDVLEDDFQRVKANTPRRLSKLINDDSRDLVLRTLERDEIIYGNVRADFEETSRVIEGVRRQLSVDDVPRNIRIEAFGTVKDAREDLLLALQNLRVLQVGQRAELIDLQDFDMELEEAIAIALENRLDLMNARARVMDVRRNMEVAANRLEAVLNIVAEGDLRTTPTGNHPLDFRGTFSTFRFGVQMVAPVDQMQVRNQYRSALVSYQQARRAYMLLEDQVKYDIRTSWRQLQVNRQNLESNRKNLRQAALQFDINVANNLNPRAQGQNAGQAGTTNLGNSSGLNINNALQALLTAQNALIQNWASYERNRINIYRDMDIMQIDERGLWIDPVYQRLGDRSHSHPDEPADVHPSASENDSAARSADAGFIRLARGAAPRSSQIDVEAASHRAGRPGWTDRWWRRGVAPAEGTVHSGEKRN